MRASIVLPGDDDPLSAFSNVKRLVETVGARPAAARAKSGREGSSVQERDRRGDEASDVPVELSGDRDVTKDVVRT